MVLESHEKAKQERTANTAAFDAMVAKLNPTMGVGRPSYIPSLDRIDMPPAESFVAYENYCFTMGHELGHWTGAGPRCNRKGITERTGFGFGSSPYAYEELVAEWVSTLLANHFGLRESEKDAQNRASYLKGWDSKLKGNPESLVDSFRDAEKAFSWALTASGERLSYEEQQAKELAA